MHEADGPLKKIFDDCPFPKWKEFALCCCTTSRRLDATNYVHVAGKYDDAIDWATRHGLLQIEEFAVFRIDLHAGGISLLRDPFSHSTGYILDTFHVAPKHLHRWGHG